MDTPNNYICLGCDRVARAHKAFMQRQRDTAAERERLFKAEVDEHDNHTYPEVVVTSESELGEF